MGIGRARTILAAGILAITGVLPGTQAVLSQGHDDCAAALLAKIRPAARAAIA